MSLEFVEDSFDLPALVIQRRQLQRRGRFGVEDVRHQPIATAEEFAGAVYRETRHAEQRYMMARTHAGRGKTAA